MITSKELEIYSCEFRDTFIKEFNSDKITAPELIDKVFYDSRINREQKQYIYYRIRKHHSKEFKSQSQRDMYGLGWNWFNSGINLYDCNDIVKSDYITKSHHIKFSNWVNKCSNSDHLYFCNNLSDASYQVFNQPVTPVRFRELTSLSLTELKKQPEFNKHLYRLLKRIHKLLLKGESHNETNND